MSDRRDLIRNGGLLAVLLALVGIWLYAAGRPAETEFDGIEANAGEAGHQEDRDPAEAGARRGERYTQLDLGRMVVRREGPAAVSYWAIYFNVGVKMPIPSNGPEIYAIRDAVLEALVAVMDDTRMRSHPLSASDVRQRVIDKLGDRFPNVVNISVREATRSEVGRM